MTQQFVSAQHYWHACASFPVFPCWPMDLSNEKQRRFNKPLICRWSTVHLLRPLHRTRFVAHSVRIIVAFKARGKQLGWFRTTSLEWNLCASTHLSKQAELWIGRFFSPPRPASVYIAEARTARVNRELLQLKGSPCRMTDTSWGDPARRVCDPRRNIGVTLGHRLTTLAQRHADVSRLYLRDLTLQWYLYFTLLPWHHRPLRTPRLNQWTQNICIAFVHCWTNVEDVGPTLYKFYTNVLCLLGFLSPLFTLFIFLEILQWETYIKWYYLFFS